MTDTTLSLPTQAKFQDARPHALSSPQAVYVLRWLVRDTFHQALATRLFWILFALSGLCIFFCLSISIEGGGALRPEGDILYHPRTDQPLTGPTADLGELRFLFGAFKVSLARDRAGAVHFLHTILGTWMAGTLGLLLTLIWTAGLVPQSLEANNAAVLFSKPTPRWLFLVGKFVGVLLLVIGLTAIFFVGTWLALGLRTGEWGYGYLAGIPLLVLQFAGLYSASVFLAVQTRSSAACVLGTLLFWALCLGINYGRHSAVALPHLAPETPHLSSFTMYLVDAAYWILPKPLDCQILLEEALQSGSHLATLSSMPEFSKVRELGEFNPIASILTTLLLCGSLVGYSGRELNKLEY